MPHSVPQLAIEDIADLPDAVSLFGLADGDALDISLMDVVIAIIDQPCPWLRWLPPSMRRPTRRSMARWTISGPSLPTLAGFRRG